MRKTIICFKIEKKMGGGGGQKKKDKKLLCYQLG